MSTTMSIQTLPHDFFDEYSLFDSSLVWDDCFSSSFFRAPVRSFACDETPDWTLDLTKPSDPWVDFESGAVREMRALEEELAAMEEQAIVPSDREEEGPVLEAVRSSDLARAETPLFATPEIDSDTPYHHAQAPDEVVQAGPATTSGGAAADLDDESSDEEPLTTSTTTTSHASTPATSTIPSARSSLSLFQHDISTIISSSTLTTIPGAWSSSENAAAAHGMISAINASLRREHEGRTRIPAGQLYHMAAAHMRDAGEDRTAIAIKNQWNRFLRAATGVDERRSPRVSSLATSQQVSARRAPVSSTSTPSRGASVLVAGSRGVAGGAAGAGGSDSGVRIPTISPLSESFDESAFAGPVTHAPFSAPRTHNPSSSDFAAASRSPPPTLQTGSSGVSSQLASAGLKRKRVVVVESDDEGEDEDEMVAPSAGKRAKMTSDEEFARALYADLNGFRPEMRRGRRSFS